MKEGEGSIRVLIVEDHAMVAEGLEARISSESDMKVVGIARNIGDGIAMARDKAPDVVLMDYHLPDGTGVEATREIRRERPETMVVMVTGQADDRVLLEAIEAGCSGFITKDKLAQEVIDAVRAASAGEALISPAMLARLLPKLMKRDQGGVGAKLTKREVEILQLLAEGLSNQQIAAKLVLSLHTVRNHVQNVIAKTGTHSKLEAVAKGAREGLISYR